MKAAVPHESLARVLIHPWLCHRSLFFKAHIESASERCWLLDFPVTKRLCGSSDLRTADLVGRRLPFLGGREKTFPARSISDLSLCFVDLGLMLQEILRLAHLDVFWGVRGIAAFKLRPRACSTSSPIRNANSQASRQTYWIRNCFNMPSERLWRMLKSGNHWASTTSLSLFMLTISVFLLVEKHETGICRHMPYLTLLPFPLLLLPSDDVADPS